MANKNAGENGKATRFKSGEEAAINGRKGGIASGISRSKLPTFREQLLRDLTEEDIKAMNDALKRNAKRGSLPHTQYLMRMLGEEPKETIGVEITSYEQMLKAVENAEDRPS